MTTPNNFNENPQASEGFFAPLGRSWLRVSPRLVPLLAVMTAFLIGIPLTLLTGGGFGTAGQAYSALIEGGIGVAINDVADITDFDTIRQYAENFTIEATRITRQSRPFVNVAELGVDNVQYYAEFLARYPDLDEDAIDNLATRIPTILAIGPDVLREMGDVLTRFAEIGRTEIEDAADLVFENEELSDADYDFIYATWPELAEMDEDAQAQGFAYLRIVGEHGLVTVQRTRDALLQMDELGIIPGGADSNAIINIAAAGTGDVLDGVETWAELAEVGVTDATRLALEFNIIGKLYEEGFLTSATVNEALETELPGVLDENLFIIRPDRNFVIIGAGEGHRTTGVLSDSQDLPAHYLRLGGSALMFFPSLLEDTLTNSIRFIIAGLAVALGFKAGLFNIGAEGQIYAGATLAAAVGFMQPFSDWPFILHLPLMVIVGIVGGFFWGAIPGFLKAFTGAHEVITTIMLNFVAIRLVDWLIKSTDPVLLGDVGSSVPKTPTISDTAILPPLNQVSLPVYIVIAVVVVAYMLWPRRNQMDTPTLIRSGIFAAVIIIGGSFLSAITARGNLHIGFIIMLFCVWLTDWFLERTTPGFELRTVGANPDAAKYAGMSVRRNVILAMALSGALAGLAGMIEVSGRQHNLLPGFFGGAGFDAIAVALIARTNPRSMIWAGLLWGGLLSGAGLMQIRADIPIDMVKIIQALIIMFISADQIIRFVYRVPEAKEEEKVVFSSSWGG